MTGLYKAFVETRRVADGDQSVHHHQGRQALFALDCKINFDDNAMFRHKDLKELRDLAEEDPLEVEASKYALNYIKLDGNIACMVNGAGLAMATMDIIQYAGGSPANFLDVGGGANQQQIEHAFGILLSDKNVKAIFINIFGGILRVDVLAHGVVEAAKKLNVKVPIILRLEGTNVEEGTEDSAGVGAEVHRWRHHAGRGTEGRRSGEGSGVDMSVLVDKNTRLIVQGITGREGTFHAKGCAEYGTKVVGGVTPGKGGTTHEGWPVFDTVRRGGEEDGRECHGDLRAAAVCRRRHSRGRTTAGLPLIICITEGIPMNDMVKVWSVLKNSKLAADRAELPGRHFAGQSEGRHHAGPDPQGRLHRDCLALGHADL